MYSEYFRETKIKLGLHRRNMYIYIQRAYADI